VELKETILGVLPKITKSGMGGGFRGWVISYNKYII
jgi:hypothetical protein